MLLKFANTSLLEARIAQPGAALMRTSHRATFTYEPRPGFLYVRSRAISSRTNDNFDTFPADQIKQAWSSFIGKPVFVNHHNDDHKRARGVIIDAALHEDHGPDGTADTWVEVLMEVDALRFPRLAAAIIAGDIERTSMGCDVAFSVCSVCGNKATTPVEYCSHIPRLKGKRIRRRTASGDGAEDVLCHEVCHGLSFFENSLLVEPPADPTAFFTGVDTRGVPELAMTASRKAQWTDGADEPHSEWGELPEPEVSGEFSGESAAKSARRTAMPTKTGYGEVKAPAAIDTLRAKECSVCGEEDSFDGDGRCRVCGYLPPPEPFRDPDLDVAQKADMRDGPVNPDLFKAPPFEVPEDTEGKPEDQSKTQQPNDPDNPGATDFGKKSGRRTVNPDATPLKGQGTEGAPMRPNAATAARQQQIIQTQAERIARLEHTVASLRRQADGENPAQPVPEPGASAPSESTDATRPADTQTSVTTPGGVMPAPSADANTEVTTPGGTIPAVEAPSTEVTSPVAGGVEVPVPDVRTEVDVVTSGETIGDNAFGGDWVATAQARTFASLRLARLRLAAGIEQGDDLDIAQKIANSKVTDDAIRSEITTLAAVKKQAARRAPQAPIRQQAVRGIPSLVSTASPVVAVQAPSMAVGNDEFLFD